MNPLILHHYPVSPFAEKVRALLGFKKLAWQSVLIPMMMPKPDVVALTGGYRRTPILQIGADVYCDTALIARVLTNGVRDVLPFLAAMWLGEAIWLGFAVAGLPPSRAPNPRPNAGLGMARECRSLEKMSSFE